MLGGERPRGVAIGAGWVAWANLAGKFRGRTPGNGGRRWLVKARPPGSRGLARKRPRRKVAEGEPPVAGGERGGKGQGSGGPTWRKWREKRARCARRAVGPPVVAKEEGVEG